MANPRIQVGATTVNGAQSQGILSQGGVDFSLQNLLSEIALRFVDLMEGVLIIVIGILLIRFVRRYFQKVQTQYETQRTALNLMEKLTAGFLAVVTVTLALKVVGLDITLLVSALTLGLSFALGDIIKNYVAGILILFKSPFKIGDVVKIQSYTGRVERIDFQSTTIKTFDRKEVTIYNNDILTQSLINFSKHDRRRLKIDITLGRGTDMSRALSIFEAILADHPQVMKAPRFNIIFKQFSIDGMQFTIRFWVKKPVNILKIRSDIALQIEQAFDESAIFSSYERQIQFTEDVTMNDGRKQRLGMFYGQPKIASIAAQTSTQLQTLLSAPIALSDEEVIDTDEPEAGDA